VEGLLHRILSVIKENQKTESRCDVPARSLLCELSSGVP
jgi:hypothetical protein